jgi:NAD(P)H-hydrate epimerase
LPADDPELFELDLRGLRERWASAAARAPIGSEGMTGADLRAQKLGVPGQRLMEHAGVAVAAAVKAIAEATGRWTKGPILILCGPGNNGGDGLVAARHLARAGAQVAAVLVSTAARPSTPDAARNWDRLDREPRVSRLRVTTALELRVLAKDVDRASVVVDALLGTGVQGELRDPIRSAVELVLRARAAKVPIVAVDTPTAVDLTSGDPSAPVVRADLTVTFHRPKTGLLTKRGATYAGKVLVAPIGIPQDADRG